jgi:hypothetical protein
MTDRSLAGGVTVEGTFTPDQLYAGEADIVTTQGVVNSNQPALAQYTVVALVAGKLIAYDKEAGVTGADLPYGVLPHAIPDSGSDQNTPVIIGGVLNFDALVADSATYDVLRLAFAKSNSNIVIQKLK